MRRILCALALGCAALALPALARAGSGVQPAAGSTTGAQPTFVVSLDSTDSLASVYVATSTAMTSTGAPVDEVGLCQPTTPSSLAGEFTCQPSGYSNNGGASSLPPGTYYWWLSYWTTDADHPAGANVVSGPFVFTVAAPTEPVDVYAVSPADGATTSAAPTLSYHLPAGVTGRVLLSDSPARLTDGTPAGLTVASCSGTATADATYTCSITKAAGLVAGKTYYWWLIVTVDGSSWNTAVRSLTVAASSSGGGGGGTSAPVHGVTYAPHLPSSAHYTGRSVKQTRLAKAAYQLSKIIGLPKTVDVACWSAADWENISGDNPESGYTLLGFYMPAMPHWLELSPTICHTMETLLYKRPEYANRYTANAVDTLTHEMIHALGVTDEARTECYAMQLSWITAETLGVPAKYSYSLSRLTLANYGSHPARYINYANCRDGGAWDLFKDRPSLPWHNFQV
jgi:hypothetical protein